MDIIKEVQKFTENPNKEIEWLGTKIVKATVVVMKL